MTKLAKRTDKLRADVLQMLGAINETTRTAAEKAMRKTRRRGPAASTMARARIAARSPASWVAVMATAGAAAAVAAAIRDSRAD